MYRKRDDHKNRTNIWIVLASLILIIACFSNTNLIYNEKSNKLLIFVAVGVLFLFFVFFLKEIVYRSYIDKEFRIVFLMYFAILLFCSILASPINISWGDMVKIYNSVLYYDAAWKYNYLTSIFHICSYLLFPYIEGSMLFASILIAWLFAFFYCRCKLFFKENVGVSLIVFSLLPTIYYGLYANRMPLFSMLYFFYFGKIILDYYEEKQDKKDILCTIIIGAVLSFWRKETIFLLILVPFIIFFTYKISVSMKNYIKYFICTLIIFLIISIPQKLGESKLTDKFGEEQKQVICLFTLSTMMYEGVDISSAKNNEEMQIIQKYVSVEQIKKLIEEKGDVCLGEVYCNWHEDYYAWKMDKQGQNFSEFYRACIKFYLKNLNYFIKGKIAVCRYSLENKYAFLDTNPMDTIQSSYEGEAPYLFNGRYRNIFNELFSSSLNYRQNNILTSTYSLVKKLEYNAYIPLLFLGIWGGYNIIQRRKLFIVLSIFYILHFGSVFVMAPGGYFMYYLPLYLIGYFLLGFYMTKYSYKEELYKKY